MAFETNNMIEEHFARHGRNGLVDVIARNLEDLNDSWSILHPDQPFSEFENMYEEMRQSGEITGEILSRHAVLRIMDESDAPEISVLLKSYALTKLAREAYDQNDHEKSWSYIASARYCAGEFTAECLIRMRHASEHDLSAKATKGGRARAKQYEPTKLEVIRLLKEKRPALGWKTPAHAANTIHDDVGAFIKKNRDGSGKTELAPATLAHRLRSWMHHDESVSREFNLLVAIKPS